MTSYARTIGLAAALAGFAVVATPIFSQTTSTHRPAWGACCGMSAWPQPSGSSAPAPGASGQGGMMGGGMMGGGMMGGSMARNHAAMMGGVPAPYTHLSNPLPRTPATVEHGAKVYAENCASCHGDTGLGDGPAARGLNPKPANLAMLSRMPMSRWDPFMYWTVSEGGSPFGSAMPSFKNTLSDKDRWAVIAYIQARLPKAQRR